MSDGFELIIFLLSDAQPSRVARSVALSRRRRARNEVLSSVRLTLSNPFRRVCSRRIRNKNKLSKIYFFNIKINFIAVHIFY